MFSYLCNATDNNAIGLDWTGLPDTAHHPKS